MAGAGEYRDGSQDRRPGGFRRLYGGGSFVLRGYAGSGRESGGEETHGRAEAGGAGGVYG